MVGDTASIASGLTSADTATAASLPVAVEYELGQLGRGGSHLRMPEEEEMPRQFDQPQQPSMANKMQSKQGVNQLLGKQHFLEFHYEQRWW